MQIDGRDAHAEDWVGMVASTGGTIDTRLGSASSGAYVCMCVCVRACVRGGDGVGDVDGRACIV